MIATTFDTVAAQVIPSSLKAWTAGAGPRTRVAVLWKPAVREADGYSPVYTLKGYRAAHGSRVRSAMIGGPAAADKGDR